ncbi:hypothetical protein ACXC9Q_04210 [Kribbella sp. CWNU-51]
MDDQSREHDAITSSENLVFPLDRERAENGDTHTPTLDPSATAVNGRDTAAIPALARATSVVLGGIALGGAGLGITLGVQRRRDRSSPHPA